jgi:murein DD-endopeptidase MepM/ murein hydrolase activator NlpD
MSGQKAPQGYYAKNQAAGYSEYENPDANIGGEDYATPEEAEEFEVYDELFLFNELNAGETFDPEKMIDSIPVYLISPWSNCFTFPLKTNVVNSDFGWRRSRFHSGIDLDLETGDEVVASFDGIVKKADYLSGYGNLVVLKHFNGLETYYAHLSKIKVAEGDTLNAGEILGLGGSTGRSTGPHLHFEIRYRGAAIDPKNIVDFKAADLKFEMFYLKKEHFRPAGSKSTPGGKSYYTVRKGDTLSKIASRNGTTVSKICKLNGISSKKILKPGMKLRIR